MAGNVAKVLIIAGGPIESFVQALAAMRRIREAHPDAEITLLTEASFAALAEACPYVDRVDPTGAPEDFADWRALVGRLRAARYQRVYDLDGSARTNLMFQLLRPFAPKWSGVAAGCALPHRNPRRGTLHPLERQADQLKAAGIWPDAPTSPYAAPPPDVSWILRRVLEGRAPARPQALLVPGPATTPPERRWPTRLYADLALRLRPMGYEVVVIGGLEDGVLAQAIQHRAQVRDLTGRTDFARIAALAARAELAVGGDAGLMHLVAAAGAPTLALLPRDADPARAAPRGHVAVLQTNDLEALSVDEVLRAIQHFAPPKRESV